MAILEFYAPCNHHMFVRVFLDVNICPLLKEVKWDFISFKGNTSFYAQSTMNDHDTFLFSDMSVADMNQWVLLHLDTSLWLLVDILNFESLSSILNRRIRLIVFFCTVVFFLKL